MPSKQEILNGLLEGAVNQLKQTKNAFGQQPNPESLKEAIDIRIAIWIILFRVSNVSLGGELDVPLTNESIFADPKHDLTKFLLYIYSMESFIPQEMKRIQL